jgi:plastocyanin
MVIANQDTLAVALMAILLVGLGLLRVRGGSLGLLVIGLLSADVAIWTVSGAANNFANAEHLSALLLPAYLGLISLGSIVATIGTWLARHAPEKGAGIAQGVGIIVLVALLVVTATGLIQRPDEVETAGPADIALAAQGMKFDNIALSSNAGQVTIALTNEDFWWHTFTVDELGVDLRVPMGAERSVTFNAEPGTYRFYCAIPGHETAGMHGTLTIQ